MCIQENFIKICCFEMKWLFSVLLCLLQTAASLALPPPKVPPDALLEELTMGARVPLQNYYVDDSRHGLGTHYKYSHEEIVEMVGEACRVVESSLRGPPPSPPRSISHGMWMSQLTDIWLVHALQRHQNLTDKDVVVFGSTSPWYESIALCLGARTVTVVEYNLLTYSHPSIVTTLLSNLTLLPQFDVALSLSSFDHDGLGRYGDPLDANGDLKAMDTTAKVLKDDGVLFLTVPIGPDVVVWNLHRRYGPLRLPVLLAGWEKIDVIGWDERFLTAAAPYTIAYEPVFVLRKQKDDQLL